MAIFHDVQFRVKGVAAIDDEVRPLPTRCYKLLRRLRAELLRPEIELDPWSNGYEPFWHVLDLGKIHTRWGSDSMSVK